MSRVLLVFLDGVGVGVDDPAVNPFLRARMDVVSELLASQRATLCPLDAMLDTPGIPQSGTGQTALLTGINAAREFGRHFGPWVPTVLRARLAHENVLTVAGEAGKAVAFAHAYPEELFADAVIPRSRDRERGPITDPLRAGPPIAAMGAGVLNRHTPQLVHGDAVASEITNDGWRKHLKRSELPIITPAEAGRNLARIAAHHDLTLFAHYSTDYIGHRGEMWEAVEALQKIDDFIGGIVAAMSTDTTVIVASDHGNIEDIRTGHTQNPAYGLFIGQAHRGAAQGVSTLTDIAPRVLSLLGVSTP